MLAGAAAGLLVLVLTAGPLPFPGLDVLHALVVEAALAVGAPPPRRGMTEAAANVALFVPLGAAARVWLRRTSGARLVAWLTAGSIAIEGLQVLLPGRVPSLRDIACNAVGAALGVSAATAARLWWTRRSRGHGRQPDEADGGDAGDLTCRPRRPLR